MVLDNRSDVLLLFDAKDCNPNGDPLTADNLPRIDSYTQQGLVTPGRVKRYLRDQMFDDGEPILVRKPDQYSEAQEEHEDDVLGISEMFDTIVEEAKEEGVEIDVEDDEVARKRFLNYVTDVRFFGNVLADARPDAVKGPLQFSVGRTLHEVSRNQDASKITSSASTDDKGKGGAMGSDERIHYGLFAVDGDLNENVAENTGFSEEDAQYLDSLTWRALSNQTHSHTKSGQTPAVYVRVEYSTDDFQIGRLSDRVGMEKDVEDQMLRTPSQYSIDLTEFAESLDNYEEHIEAVHYYADETVFTVTANDTEQPLENVLSGDYELNEISVWE